MIKSLTPKEKKFNKMLVAAKIALKEINIPFHLHFGTALGAHREKSFIPHDNDIDIAVFAQQVNKPSQVKNIIKAMTDHGFTLVNRLGKLDSDLELQFEMYDIGFDIFWIYKGQYRGKPYFIYSSRFGICDKLPKKKCIFGVRPYKTVRMNFLGHTYNVIPVKTLVDTYGPDWTIPKKYNYFQGLENGNYSGLLTDYYKLRPINTKVAFCFLLYDTHKHNQIWIDFFKQDNYPIKNYTIYSHLKEINDKTPDWLVNNSIPSIKTGWCEESLVLAWVKLLQAALKDPTNKYFVLLSGECIPLFTFNKTYKKITSLQKSRFSIEPNSEATHDTGLAYADQWVTLTRKHAKMLVSLVTTAQGKQFMKDTKANICSRKNCYCPDEIYPINWFIHKYGNASSPKFKKNIKLVKTTFTYWDGKKPHPVKLNASSMEKKRKSICKSGALFARKFNGKAGRKLAMTC